MPLWRAHAAMETLHPQWNGYGYTWRRDLNAIAPENYSHSERDEQILVASPFYALMQRARAGEDTPEMRRRIDAGPEERDFPVLEEFYAQGATDYLAQLFVYGETRRPLAGNRHRLFLRDGSQGRIQRRRRRRSCRRPCPLCRWR